MLVQTDMFGASEPLMDPIQKRNRRLRLRNEKIRKRCDELYNEARLRYDDVLANLAAEFHLAELTVKRILKQG